MKKKIAVISIILVLTMIFSAVTPIMASAETVPPVLSIAGKNLSFSDSIYIIFYVEAQNVQADEVKLLVWDKAQTSYTADKDPKILSCLRTETIDGKDYLRFEYRDLAAKNMADTIYARAFTESGSDEYYSEVTNYSVLQYAYNKLGKTGTATTDEALQILLEKMLQYGASAQIYFNYKTQRLATADFFQIKLDGGLFLDGCNRGLFTKGETLLLTANAPADGMKFSGWKNDSGEMISTDKEVWVTVGASNATYTAVFCPLDHSTCTSDVVAPTSTKDGYTLYTCQNCGEVYKADYIETIGSEGLAYTANSDGTCSVTGIGTCTDTEIVIPEYIDGYRVTSIGSKAFQNNTTLKSVCMPDTVTTIGSYAFQGCSALEYVDFSNSLTTIEGYAFQNCTLLSTPIVLPTSLTSIEGYAFSSCSGIKSIYYAGTEEDWNAIDIDYGITIGDTNYANGNNYLQSATFYYLYNYENYIINEATGSITIDAAKDDAYTSMILADNKCVTVSGFESTGKGYATTYIAYTDTGLYIYAEVDDDTVLTTDGDNGDMFQVYVDFVNNHSELGLYANDYRTTVGTAGSKNLGWIYVKPDGTTRSAWGFSGVSISSAAQTISGGYAVELFIPFPASGLNTEKIGIGYEVKDDVDGDGVRDSAYYNTGNGSRYYLHYNALADFFFTENTETTAEKIDYTKVNIGLDGYKDAAYRTKVDISAPWSSNPSGSKGNGTAWISQDSTGLYFYVDVIDDKVFNNDDGDAGEGDRVQIYLDYANNHEKLGLSGTDYRATYSTAAGCLGYIAIAPDGDIKATYSFAAFGNIKATTRLTDTGYAVEVYVPFANKTIMSDTIGIGFELQNDTDGVIGSNGKHSREAIFFDKAEGISYYLNYDWLTDYEIEEKPILTSFCFTDVHNNFAMLEPPYTIRGTATLAIEQMLATEGKVDVTVIGGDYMSDYPGWITSGKLPYEYFLGYKAKTIETFAELAEGGKTLYIAGNHDYAQGEAATDGPGTNGSYNSFEFYYGEGAMQDTMGTLEEGDAFWKIGENTGEKYLIAYYYEINGIGFAGLSPDPDIIWEVQGDGFSDESLAWLDQKLDIEDPDGTKVIFVNCHYPIDGRGPSGNSRSAYNAEKLIPVFLGHNNLFHLYGHWETWFDDYTVNSLFHYDTEGNLVEGAGSETDSDQILAASKRGFNAVYMGHFRPMYNDNPDWFFNDGVYGYGGYDEQAIQNSTKTPKIAQGMYIEVYKDRVVFTMKNFGILPGYETGTELVPYTVYLNQYDGFFESDDDVFW